ncbi:MAG: RNB domain-containing ribonuclease [Elusimicrobia bacterium]|nr:RNB domain-containing ribonuclease [Elusimicrobiota bacterium]
MKPLRRLVAGLLALAFAVQPAASQVRVVAPAPAAPALPTVVGQSPAPLSLNLPSLSAAPKLAVPSLAPAPTLVVSQALTLPHAAAARALAAPIRAASAAKAEEPKTEFARKVQSIAAGVAEAGKGLENPGADGGRGAAEKVFSILGGGSVISGADADLSPAQLDAVKGVSDSLERAVAVAAGRVLRGMALSVRSRGSSSRFTNTDDKPDYDVMVRVGGTPEEAAAAISENLPALKASLTEAVLAEARPHFPGVELKVSVEGPVQLSDPADRSKVSGVFMLPVHVYGPSGLLVDSDVTFTGRPEYANDYPGAFDAQLAALERVGVPRGAALADIRLAKRFFTGVLGSYKAWQGGPSGVGVEQMVLQSGGSFDGMMAKMYDAAFEADGLERGAKKARRHWLVKNQFMAPANFVDLISDKAWTKLAFAAKAYREAKAAGRTVGLDALRPEKAAPTPLSQPRRRDIPVVAAALSQTPSLDMAATQNQVRTKELVRSAVKRLRAAGRPVEDYAVALRRAEGRGIYTVTLRLPAGADAPAVMAELTRLLRAGDPRAAFSEAAAPALRAPDAWVVLRARGGGAALEKTAKKLSKRLGLGRGEFETRPGGVYALGYRLGDMGGAEFAQAVKGFFNGASGAELVSVEVPQSAPEAAPAESVGRLTLEMLTRFTQDGPAPAARGDAYLYAQGAKALPAGLEDAGRARAAAPLIPGPGESLTRTKLYRRGGRAYILLEDPEAEGPNTTRPVKVPLQLAQGIVTDTLVEAVYQGKFIRALRPIGAYAADMVIGRVTRVGSELRLSALFTGDQAKVLYAPLPLSAAASEGRILQAFVRPAQAGFEAVPLIDLGTELTPEIAAREIALRHGARGYFEREVIEQAEGIGRSQDPEADFKRMKESKGRSEDLRALPFVTIDPAGAGDLDDAYYIRREADGSWTWYLATADVGAYVRPGTPAFRAAARIGNTFYSVDKEGVPEYPMNHPVVSKSVSSLLAGKDSLAMVTKMRFSPEGKFLLEDSEVFLGLVRVQGRYTYGQVAELWKGKPDHGIAHVDQVALARELSRLLDGQDSERGKLKLSFIELRHGKGADGRWGTSVVEHDPLESESHRLIEELKVYGNRAIATRLEAVAAGAPHISRVHPAQDEKVDERLRKELSAVGAPWRSDETLWRYLARLKADAGLSAEVKETAQLLALRSRASALYAADDAEGHEGLALAAKAYDHPSTPIRRFSDMYNRALLEAYLEGGDPKAVHEAVVADLKALGFSGFEEYLDHLNGREQAARRMDREFEAFMAVYELAKPENKGRRFTGYVKMLKEGRNAEAVIQLRELPVSITLSGEEARRFKLLGEVSVLVRSADPSAQSVDAVVTPAGGR